MSADRVRVFKRLETDAEFRARVESDGSYTPSWHLGDTLDDYVWKFYKKQRKIIEEMR